MQFYIRISRGPDWTLLVIKEECAVLSINGSKDTRWLSVCSLIDFDEVVIVPISPSVQLELRVKLVNCSKRVIIIITEKDSVFDDIHRKIKLFE